MMKNILILFTLFILFSCNNNKTEKTQNTIVEKKIPEKVSEGVIIPEVQEIGNLFKPEIMKQEEIEMSKGFNKYQYTLTNSDLLDSDLKNAQNYSNQILKLYYKFLKRINKPFNYSEIIVKVIHRNGKIDLNRYSEMEVNKILSNKKKETK